MRAMAKDVHGVELVARFLGNYLSSSSRDGASIHLQQAAARTHRALCITALRPIRAAGLHQTALQTPQPPVPR